MNYAIRMRCGFFRTARYVCSLEKNRLLFIPASKDVQTITIEKSSLLSVAVLSKQKATPVQIEIRTKDRTYSGFIDDPILAEAFLEALEIFLGKDRLKPFEKNR